jgi:hypothetical protein
MKLWHEQACEPLERRDLLAADLTCAIDSPSSGRVLERGVQYGGTLTVNNLGDTLGSDARVKVQIYLTQDTTFNAATASALTGASATFIGALYSGDSQSDSFAFTLPTSLAGGTWRMFAWADPEQLAPESNRGNNISQGVTFTLAGEGTGGGTEPDPVVDLTSSVTLLNAALVTNSPIRLNVTVTNLGTDPIPAPGTFAQVFRTRSTIADPTVDQQVGDSVSFYSLGANASASAEVSFTFSEADSTGSWRFYAIVDGSNQTVETNNANNTSTLVSGQFNFGVRDLAGTLVSTTMPSQLVQGQKLSKSPTLRYTYRNAGDYSMARSSSMSVQAYLRPISAVDTSMDIAVSSARSESVSNMAAGVSRTRDLSLKVPTTVVAGTYRLVVMLDQTMRIAELNENNNLLELGTFITVQTPTFDPALSAVTLAYPSTIKAGKAGKVSLELSNTGNTSYKNQISIQFFFLDGTGSEVSTITQTRKVEIRTDKVLKLSNLSVKAPTVAGTYTMGVRVLLPDGVAETNVFNNSADLGQVIVTA